MNASSREPANYVELQEEAEPADDEGLEAARSSARSDWFRHARSEADRWFRVSAVCGLFTVVCVIRSQEALQTLPLTWSVILPFCAAKLLLAVPLIAFSWYAVRNWRYATALYAAKLGRDDGMEASVVASMASVRRNLVLRKGETTELIERRGSTHS